MVCFDMRNTFILYNSRRQSYNCSIMLWGFWKNKNIRLRRSSCCKYRIINRFSKNKSKYFVVSCIPFCQALLLSILSGSTWRIYSFKLNSKLYLGIIIPPRKFNILCDNIFQCKLWLIHLFNVTVQPMAKLLLQKNKECQSQRV